MTYVISQHMAQDAHSALMVELLNRVSPLPITQALPDEKLLPDHIYLIPPGRNGVIQGGHIRLRSPPERMLSIPSVDVLFDSIAQDCKSHGIGVVLSGTGSDGTTGSRAIRKCGGITFAQDPHSAVYDGMPSSAIASGAIDFICDEARLFAEMVARIPDLSRNSLAGSAALPREKTPAGTAFQKILQLVTRATGTDFSGYKAETLQRRLEKRQTALNIASMESYLEHVQKHPGELANLEHAFLVTLSSFFRDQAAFRALQQALGRLAARKKPGEGMRVWVPGCGSGEEVYTVAIILCELMGKRIDDVSITIIGSDLNPQAIAYAVEGIYEQGVFKEMDPKLFERYFSSEDGRWKVAAHLQSMCQFECTDVLRRGALPNLDLISCRNLLIYLNLDTQKKMFQKFHECLVPHGLLFLGQSESVGVFGEVLFVPIDSYYRIFERH
jgi:chemotaxis methyl-accepting protein methylase